MFTYTDMVGTAYGPGDLVAVAMSNHGTSNLSNMTIAVVEGFESDKYGCDVVVARPYAEAFESYGSLGSGARKRHYKPENVIALPGKTLADLTTAARTPDGAPTETAQTEGAS